MLIRFHSRWLSIRMRIPGLPRRFRASTLLWGVTVVALLFAWRRDHVRLEDQYSQLRGEIMTNAKGSADWGVEQLLGPPDTAGAGDLRTAWASETQDGQKEWLLLTYANDVRPSEIEIHETYNPGAVYQVSIFDQLGREVVIWKGTDPTKPGSKRGVSKIPVKSLWTTKKVKVYLDSPAITGWNEIDTVGLRDARGKIQWPSDATASSAFGGRERHLGGAADRHDIRFGSNRILR